MNRKEYLERQSVYNKRFRDSHKEEIALYYATPERKLYTKKYDLKKRFNITLEQYNEIFDEQHGFCAICGKHQSKFNYALCVEHNHETKEIRGLVCKRCNIIIANCDEDINILLNAIKYLTK
jgi:hypothetical protein